VVNLNSATEAELMLLPGVGPSKAAAVLAFRKKYGAFKKVEDLSKVKGFSYKTLKKLKPYLALSGATTYKGKAKKTGAHGGDDGASVPAAAANEP
jgi:competence ComEA-like helix-hairpin-helix protein